LRPVDPASFPSERGFFLFSATNSHGGCAINRFLSCARDTGFGLFLSLMLALSASLVPPVQAASDLYILGVSCHVNWEFMSHSLRFVFFFSFY
jgi:hypothetical protein